MNYDSRWQNLQEEHIIPLSEKAYLSKHSLRKQVGKEMESQVKQNLPEKALKGIILRFETAFLEYIVTFFGDNLIFFRKLIV